MMLRKRSFASSILPSPRSLVALPSKSFSDTEHAMSPTFIHESKNFPALKNPSLQTIPAPTVVKESSHIHWSNGDAGPIGLGIVDALSDDSRKNGARSPKQDTRVVLFGSQLKVQIPSNSSCESPQSPVEFAMKTKSSQLGLSYPCMKSPTAAAGVCSEMLGSSPKVFLRSLSAKEIELSEDYTCVISHGPNPRITHIFDDCIVESRGDEFVVPSKESDFLDDQVGHPLDDALGFCYSCKKSLGQGEDSFAYRVEKAFCGKECHDQEMQFNKDLQKCSPNSS